MAIQYDNEPAEYEGCVISDEPWHYPVCSDNAMIDSGEGRLVEVWDHGLGMPSTLHFYLGRPGPRPHITVDAPPELMARVVTFKRVHGWMSTCFEAALLADDLQVGKTVTVSTACRKVPQSANPATITKVGKNSFGQYANLRGVDGKDYTYVNPDWIRVIDAERYLCTPCPYGGEDAEVRRLVQAAAMATAGDPGLWLIVADRLEDLGNTVAPYIRTVANHWARERAKRG